MSSQATIVQCDAREHYVEHNSYGSSISSERHEQIKYFVPFAKTRPLLRIVFVEQNYTQENIDVISIFEHSFL